MKFCFEGFVWNALLQTYPPSSPYPKISEPGSHAAVVRFIDFSEEKRMYVYQGLRGWPDNDARVGLPGYNLLCTNEDNDGQPNKYITRASAPHDG
jgi:hypothetical protein